MAEFFCLAVPLFIAICMSILIYLGMNSTKWPSVKGRKIRYKISKQTYGVKFPTLQQDAVLGTIDLKYEYTVNNRTYRSSRISYLNKPYGPMEEIKYDELLLKIEKDDFAVYYCVRFPRISVLKPGFEDLQANIWTMVIIIFIGAFSYLITRLFGAT